MVDTLSRFVVILILNISNINHKYIINFFRKINILSRYLMEMYNDSKIFIFFRKCLFKIKMLIIPIIEIPIQAYYSLEQKNDGDTFSLEAHDYPFH